MRVIIIYSIFYLIGIFFIVYGITINEKKYFTSKRAILKGFEVINKKSYLIASKIEYIVTGLCSVGIAYLLQKQFMSIHQLYKSLLGILLFLIVIQLFAKYKYCKKIT
ncbi:hypothetical protein [Desnuesiella massiliensis]|uniref:hypothetical protein n=1 Tax=Desnuesiella massiliensis TaxID=1650662 RepID=UPI0006E168E9|nr:hypothetical protein [Desnuesiella massiliensis]